MSVTDPNEQARRAIARAISSTSPDFVKLTRPDTSDMHPEPENFQFEPDNLFDLTFDNKLVNIFDKTQTGRFVAALKKRLPSPIRPKIQEVFGDLNPGVKISSVFKVVRDLLMESEESAEGSATASTKKPGKG